ncbi:unnamed protein product [Musa acuminata subsp. malaccensis]|uniref:(wild Malaysian banana) hypothetical protein n=1 Tax=Musa acuminata subsp. malaccensis TaxID=214687 RepID=A0A8D7AXV8_MUSAM|nr:unnamed protein product [Musa acuminata subsp. malaccensis]
MATRIRIYFVMEYVRGGDLFSRVAKGRTLEDAARRYFQQLVSAVAFCHAPGVFHRDLKPENLLVLSRRGYDGAKLMEPPWFKKGFRRVRFYIEDDQLHSLDDASSSQQEPGCHGRRVFMRSTSFLPKGFDLSGLFEETGEDRFPSKEPVSKIISKSEEIANLMRFTVRRNGCRVGLAGTREGEHGPLTIAVEVFELISSIVVIEVTKKAGDGEVYMEFCNKELKPRLLHLVFESPPVGKTSSSNNWFICSYRACISEAVSAFDQ